MSTGNPNDNGIAKASMETHEAIAGLLAELDGLKLSKPQHRAQQLKAYGNAIVPQVAIEIMRSIVT